MKTKIILRKTLSKLTSEFKKKGFKIVLAGGCFDIFHIGHLSYLEGARALGDLLIVGINSDSSYFRVKGRSPSFVELSRARMISSLQIVDYVFIFSEDTMSTSLSVLKPDIFAKGFDYKGKEFPEKRVCRENGIEISLIGDSKESSSRELYEILYQDFKEGKL